MTESEVTVILLDTWFSASIQTRTICVWWLRSRTLKPYDLRLEWTFSLPKVWACMGFPGSSAGNESACNAGDPDSFHGLQRSPGGGHGYLLHYSCLENAHWQRSLAGYSPWGCKRVGHDWATSLSLSLLKGWNVGSGEVLSCFFVKWLLRAVWVKVEAMQVSI